MVLQKMYRALATEPRVLEKLVIQISGTHQVQAIQRPVLRDTTRFGTFPFRSQTGSALQAVPQSPLGRNLGDELVDSRPIFQELVTRIAQMVQRIIGTRNVLVEPVRKPAIQEKRFVKKSGRFQTIADKRRLPDKIGNNGLLFFFAGVPAFKPSCRHSQSREGAVPVQHAELYVARHVGIFCILARCRIIIVVVVLRPVAVCVFVVVVGMPGGKRRGEHNAISHRRTHLEGTLPRVVAPVGKQYAAAPLHGILRHEIDGTAEPCHTELRGDIALEHLDFFHLVQVDRREVHRAAARIVQRDPVHANQNVSRSNPANRHRLEAPETTLLVRLDSGKRRKEVCRRQRLTLPGRRIDFGIANILGGQITGGAHHIRRTQILHRVVCRNDRHILRGIFRRRDCGTARPGKGAAPKSCNTCNLKE